MGTRHLTAVVLDGQFKVAQYGQWDGYPEGQGRTVLKFLKKWDRKKFEASLRASSFYTNDELHKIHDEAKEKPDGWWQKTYPELSRDTGAEILMMVQESGGLKLRNTISFAGDSLFCEFAYILDLDKNVLELYKGFNKKPLINGDRFFGMEGLEKNEKYEPIRMVKTYPLRRLPTVNRMIKDCGED